MPYIIELWWLLRNGKKRNFNLSLFCFQVESQNRYIVFTISLSQTVSQPVGCYTMCTYINTHTREIVCVKWMKKISLFDVTVELPVYFMLCEQFRNNELENLHSKLSEFETEPLLQKHKWEEIGFLGITRDQTQIVEKCSKFCGRKCIFSPMICYFGWLIRKFKVYLII